MLIALILFHHSLFNIKLVSSDDGLKIIKNIILSYILSDVGNNLLTIIFRILSSTSLHG